MAESGSIREGWKRVLAAEPLAGLVDADTPDEEVVPPDPQSLRRTFIAAGARFEGTLTLTGDFHIDTEFRGALETDGTITVGPNGSVVGDIRAREVVICGAVVGDVKAPRQLIVEADGKLHGDIETACLEIQKHAFFQGRTAMTLPQASRRNVAEAKSAPETAPSPAPI